jgi:hypothetical protein
MSNPGSQRMNGNVGKANSNTNESAGHIKGTVIMTRG